MTKIKTTTIPFNEFWRVLTWWDLSFRKAKFERMARFMAGKTNEEIWRGEPIKIPIKL